MDKPLVSIVIPAYNVAPYVAQAIDSALAQTYREREVIVVDDGSTDGTREVVAPYVKEGSIIYIHQDNKGLSAARNTGIKQARGEFIAILDSDDLFLPRKIERQADYLMSHPECGVSYCDVIYFWETDPDRTLTLKSNFYSGADVFPNLLRKNFIIPLSVMFRKSEMMRVGLFDENRRRSEDWEYWLRLSYNGVQFCHLPETLGKCRLHLGSRQQGANGWENKVKERKSVLSIFNALYKNMVPAERRQYHMQTVLWENRLKLWYVLAANHFPPFRWGLQRIQANRWESVDDPAL